MARNYIVGVREVQNLLDQMNRVSARIVTGASKSGAKIALADAKKNCPVSVDGSHGNPPGTLKRSLKVWAQKKKSKGKRVYIMGPTKEGWYAHFVDYGFFATGGKRLSRNESTRAQQTVGMRWVPGNRFLRDAIDNNREKIRQEILNKLHDGLMQVR